MSDLDPWESDTRDQCDGFVLLDDGQVRLARCVQCNRIHCVCCRDCGTWGCVHTEGGEPTQRESRRWAARMGEGPGRFK